MYTYLASVITINFVQDGFTALHMACQEGHLKVAETLITAHASVNAQNKVSALRVHSDMTVHVC